MGQSTTLDPILRAIAWLPSVEPLSEIRISPSILDLERRIRALMMHASIVSASFRQGVRMVNSQVLRGSPPCSMVEWSKLVLMVIGSPLTRLQPLIISEAEFD